MNFNSFAILSATIDRRLPTAHRLPRHFATAILAAVAALAALQTGCAPSATSPPSATSVRSGTGRPAARSAAEAGDIPEEVRLGPVRLSVSVSPERPRLADQVELTVTVRTPTDVEVIPPEFANRLGDFRVRAMRADTPHLGADEDTYRYRLTLEPMREGMARVLPIAVNFRKSGAADDAAPETIESPAFTLAVASRFAAEDARLDEVTQLDGPIPPPAGRWSWMLILALLILAGVLAAAMWAIRRRRRRDSGEDAPTPREMALRDLAELRLQRLAERDVKLFFVKLTGIVRVFIERTTGVLAAEQTTEEFLRAVGSGRVVAAGDQELLREFLESADVVKFAGHRPLPHAIETAFVHAREFVNRESRIETKRTSSEVRR